MDDALFRNVLGGPRAAALYRRLGVERLELFGSAETTQFQPGRSDCDLIVRFKPQGGERSLGVRFVELADSLEAMLGTPVDLMTDHPIANPYLRAAVDASRRVVYDDTAAETSV